MQHNTVDNKDDLREMFDPLYKTEQASNNTTESNVEALKKAEIDFSNCHKNNINRACYSTSDQYNLCTRVIFATTFLSLICIGIAGNIICGILKPDSLFGSRKYNILAINSLTLALVMLTTLTYVVLRSNTKEAVVTDQIQYLGTITTDDIDNHETCHINTKALNDYTTDNALINLQNIRYIPCQTANPLANAMHSQETKDSIASPTELHDMTSNIYSSSLCHTPSYKIRACITSELNQVQTSK